MDINRTVNGDKTVLANGAPTGHKLKAALDLCIRKTRGNIKRLADEPKSAAWAVDGDYFNYQEDFYEIGNWTSSFFTGMALLWPCWPGRNLPDGIGALVDSGIRRYVVKAGAGHGYIFGNPVAQFP